VSYSTNLHHGGLGSAGRQHCAIRCRSGVNCRTSRRCGAAPLRRETHSLLSNSTRPGRRDRFEMSPTRSEPVDHQRYATKSLVALIGTMVRNGHLRTNVCPLQLSRRAVDSASHRAPVSVRTDRRDPHYFGKTTLFTIGRNFFGLARLQNGCRLPKRK
jgi:hypothetical protein